MRIIPILYAMKKGYAVYLMITILICCSYGTALSQIGLPPVAGVMNNTVGKWSIDKLRLLDPARFSMNQSYSTFFSSGGFGGGVYGIYTNVLTYRLSDPLQIKLKLNYMMQPVAFQNSTRMPSSGLLLPGMAIQYQPWKGVYLNFQVDQYRGYMSPYGFGSMFDYYR
jgi:hypothetical protein